MEQSKELELAKQVEMAINSYNFNNKKFASAISEMHRTNQQSLWRLIKECIKVFSDDNYPTDERNQASHEEAKKMVEFFKAHGRHIPML